MSVQAGIWNFDGEPVERDFLTRISTSIAEYGPDGEKTHFDGPVGMLYRPFHTTVESHVEHQPYVSVSGRVITWDGRLDNRDELIPQLCNDLTADQTDVAIIAAAFDRWSTDCFTKLIGDWALAIWDPQEAELLLARDYLGVRHLFYYPKPKNVFWCSHLAPLALCGDKFTLCDEYVAGYLAFHPGADLTPYREIRSVSPGKFVRINNRRVRVYPYWTFNPRVKIQYKTDAEYEEQFRHLFQQAVRRRLRADSPILAELSGGLDSSSITCMADSILEKDGRSTTAVDTFSYFDRGEPDEEDFLYFTEVEKKRNRTGHRAELRSAGETFSFSHEKFNAIPGFGVREELKAAKSEVMRCGKYRVVLSGLGGDEFLGQAFDFRVQLADLLVKFQASKFVKELLAWSLLVRLPWVQLLFQTLLLLLPSSLGSRFGEKVAIEPWINKEFARNQRLSARLLEATATSWLTLPSARDSAHLIASLASQLAETPPSLEEKRYPFLDQSLIEFLLAIPRDQLLRPGQRRFLMRRALSDLIPPKILSRKTKSSAGRCIPVTLQKQWHTLQNSLSSTLSCHFGFINEKEFREALLATKNGQVSQYGLRLMRGLALEFWLRGALARGVISVDSSFNSSEVASARTFPARQAHTG